MKKIFFLLCCSFILVGCQQKTKALASLEHYEQYVELLNQPQDYKSKSDLFNITLILNQLEDGKVRYDVVINNAVSRLSNIKVICKEVDQTINNYPSIGLLENESYILDPNYTNKEENIYKGINLSGISETCVVKLNILVEYQTEQDQLVREFISLEKELEE